MSPPLQRGARVCLCGSEPGSCLAQLSGSGMLRASQAGQEGGLQTFFFFKVRGDGPMDVCQRVGKTIL